MKVILKENVEHLGHIGDIVKVAPGYARNYLLPKGLVVEATERNAKALEHTRKHLEYKKNKVLESARGLAARIGALSLSIATRRVKKESSSARSPPRSLPRSFMKPGLKWTGRRLLPIRSSIPATTKSPSRFIRKSRRRSRLPLWLPNSLIRNFLRSEPLTVLGVRGFLHTQT